MTVEDYRGFSILEADRRIAYGEDDSQFIDLFLPDEIQKLQTVVLLIHGGCWQAAFGLAPMGQFARALSRRGLVVASIEYRRIGNGGGWPNTFFDTAAAADYVTTLAEAYRFEVDRVVAVGHSAGGHLALWLAARRFLDPDSLLYSASPQRISAVVALAPIPDLIEGEKQDICDDAIAELLSGRPDEVFNRFRAASPHFHLPLGIPHIHIVGAQDGIVPPAYVASFANAALEAGDDVTFALVPNAGHFEVVLATAAPWPTVEKAILSACKG